MGSHPILGADVRASGEAVELLRDVRPVRPRGGGARVGSGCASARPPAGEMATSRLAFAASNHAMARDLPSPETAMLGFVPPSLPCIGWEEKCPPRFVASTIWSAVVSAQVTCPT